MSFNFFEHFHLPVSYALDAQALEKNYRKIQAEVHPDKFVTASPSERLQSMQAATLTNEAYQTLKHPTARARYLLQLQGVETLEDSNTAMPVDFLMSQMEWREAIEEAQYAKDIAALDALLCDIQNIGKSLQVEIGEALNSDVHKAAQLVRKLSFIDKISADIRDTISRLED